MNTSKINVWVVGLCLLFAGGLLTYLYSYKHNQAIDIISYLLYFAGYLCVFMKAIKGTIVTAPKILFKNDKSGFFKQRIISFFAYGLSAGAMLGSLFWLTDLGFQRKTDILRNGPISTTIATVDHIDERHGRGGTYYYAVFLYTVNGEVITYSWSENRESDFLVGEKFRIKYSVEHPDMFLLLGKVE